MEKTRKVFKTEAKYLYILLIKDNNKIVLSLRMNEIAESLGLTLRSVIRNLSNTTEYQCSKYSIWKYPIEDIVLSNKKINKDNLTNNVLSPVRETGNNSTMDTIEKMAERRHKEMLDAINKHNKTNNTPVETIEVIDGERTIMYDAEYM